MRGVRVFLTLSALAASAVVGSCGDESTAPQPTTGRIAVLLDMTGDTPDPDGATVTIDGNQTAPIGASERVTFTDLTPGRHVVSLTGLEPYCKLNGDNPITVDAVPDSAADVRFDVLCGNALPGLDLLGMDILGSGYNVGGGYADVADVRDRVLDLSALKYAGLLRQVQYERASYDVVSGKTSSDYLKSLQVKVGVQGKAFGFSGAIRASYSQERYTSQQYAFATVRSNIRKHGVRVALSATPEDLRAYLTPAAAAWINDPSVDPLDVFNTFGHYVLAGIIVGGRLDFTTSANMSFERSSRGIDAYARFAFKKVFVSASIETQVVSEAENTAFSATEERRLEVYGGRSEYGQYIMNEGNYEAWIESVDENPVFMDFEPANESDCTNSLNRRCGGLVGIWELADDPARRASLEAAWGDYAETHGITLAAVGPIVSDFEAGAEGWRVTDLTTRDAVPAWDALGGFFGGYIHDAEESLLDTLGIVAPEKFLGDRTAYAINGSGKTGSLEFSTWRKDVFTTTTYSNCVDQWMPMLGPWSGPELAWLVSENGDLVYRAEPAVIPDDPWRAPIYECDRWRMDVSIPLKAGPTQWHAAFERYGRIYPARTGKWYKRYPAAFADWLVPATDDEIFLSLARVRAIIINGAFDKATTEHRAFDRIRLVPGGM